MLRIRKGSVHGVKHRQLEVNNQDAVEHTRFAIPSWGKVYHVGIVSDGSTGIPAYSHSEVGANLLARYCPARIQGFVMGGMEVGQIPSALYPAVTEFIRTTAGSVMPDNVVWPYDITFRGPHMFRNELSASERFRIDYLSATIVGFIDDGETLVTFQAGDGTIIVDGQVLTVDQNDIPEYPSLSVNNPGVGFKVETYASGDIKRLVLASDGIEKLLQVPDLSVADRLFTAFPTKSRGVQMLLTQLRDDFGEHMEDDCTVLTRELREQEEVIE